MWECYNCAFQNVDTSPVCARCRARKPAYGEKIQRRSYHAQELASQERAADMVMDSQIPSPPPAAKVREKWAEAADNSEELFAQLEELEARQYALREALRAVVLVLKNPQSKGRVELLQSIVDGLINWDKLA
jgi:hypothetical protein